ncbi:MAG: two-component system, NarL family, sensor kinase, partial [Thermoleophilaceae bacterium]|nr:two-component system, NarL family, sensor kinase [Thermoleophilaceae bacterium]
LTDGLLRGDRGAIARIDRIVRMRVLHDPVVRIKIWSPDGRVLYSDEPRLIGKRFQVEQENADSLAGNRVQAEVSDLSRPESRYERPYKKLLEVYMPIRTPSGKALKFESYQSFSSVAASGRRTWLAFLPALIGGLLVLWLVQLPLAARLARRIRAGQREREQLLERAINASDIERRRIAGELHDGVVQSLAGVSFSLAAAAERSPGNGNGTTDTLERAAAATRESVRELRGLLVEIYPPSLHQSGLPAALDDAASPLKRRGVEVSCDIAADLALDQDTERLLFRVAQEALRNVAAHAEASHVEIRVAREGARVSLEIADDGRGFEAGGARREGHFGLRLVEDLARDAGAELAVASQPGQGTRVRIEVAAVRA